MQDEDVGHHCASHGACEQHRSNGTCPWEEVQKSSDDFDPTGEITEPLSESDALENFDPLVVQRRKLVLAGHEKENGHAPAQHPSAEIRRTGHKPPIAEVPKLARHTDKMSRVCCVIMIGGLLPD